MRNICDHKSLCGKKSQKSGVYVSFSAATARKERESFKSAFNLADDAVCKAGVFGGGKVIPNLVKIGFRFWMKIVTVHAA